MTDTIKLAPSILSADFARLGDHVRETDVAGADLIHCDVMDGHFVPNITFGPLVIAAVRRVTHLPLDVHLMIEKPERYIEDFVKAGATMIDVHVENCPHLHRTIQQIKSLHIKAGVAINPHTPFEMIREILGDVDRVLVMTVNPGFGGQKLIQSTLPKIAQIRAAIDALGHDIELGVDGGVDTTTIGLLRRAGANVFVAGNAIFAAKEGISAAMEGLRIASMS